MLTQMLMNDKHFIQRFKVVFHKLSAALDASVVGTSLLLNMTQRRLTRLFLEKNVTNLIKMSKQNIMICSK